MVVEKNKGFISKKEFVFWQLKLAEDYKEWKETKVKSKEPYEIIPREIIVSSYLKDSERTVYLLLLLFSNNDTGQTFVSDNRLAIETGKTKRQIQKYFLWRYYYEHSAGSGYGCRAE